MSAGIKAGLLAGTAWAGLLLATPAFGQAAPTPYTSATRYDAVGRVTGTIAPDPDNAAPYAFIAVRNTYNASGNLTKVEKGTLSAWPADNVAPADWTGFTITDIVDSLYDGINRKVRDTVSARDPANGAITVVGVTQYAFDDLDRVTCTAVRMNPAFTNLPDDACTQGTRGTGANDFGADRISKTVYQGPTSQVSQVQRGLGTPLFQVYATYTYAATQKLASVTDARGFKATYLYDEWDRLKRWNMPDKVYAQTASTTDYEEYGYDANGNRTSLRKRDGRTLTYEYDALNRVTTKVVPDDATGRLAATHTRDVYYSYDLRGLQMQARFDSLSGEGMSNTWDGFGRLTTGKQMALNPNQTSARLWYEYDADGNRTKLTYPDGAYVTYQYDQLDRPTAIQRGGSATIASYAYDAAGRRTDMTGGPATHYGYDVAGRLTSIGDTLNGQATAYNNAYSFAYTPAGQIASVTRSNDLYAWTGHSLFERDYATNGLDQYTGAGGASFCYDGNGNLTADGTNVYLYDVENRLVERRTQKLSETNLNTDCGTLSYAGTLKASLRYDPAGRLFEVTAGGTPATRFLYDGDAMVQEADVANNVIRRYAHGADLKADDPIAWYEGATMDGTTERKLRADWQGSIALITDASGSSVIHVNSYDEYGVPYCPVSGGAPDCTAPAANQGRFQYTGQAWIPELGMYYYKARIYSPTLGRFMQTDPIGYKDQVNLYAYAGNDPSNRSDQTGNSTVYWYENGLIVIVQTFTNNGTQFTDQAIAAQGSNLSGATSDGSNIVTVLTPGTDDDAVQIKNNFSLNDRDPNGLNRSHTDKIGGRAVDLAPNAQGIGTVGHEIGHTQHAGDQYKDGVAADGKTILPSDVPGPMNIMKNALGKANEQTMDEIKSGAMQQKVQKFCSVTVFETKCE